jgi:hypothetical protein
LIVVLYRDLARDKRDDGQRQEAFERVHHAAR